MNKILFLLFPIIAIASSPFETPKEYYLDFSVFDKKLSQENKKAMENEKIICREICDKKLYKEQKIADAISFYKKRAK